MSGPGFALLAAVIGIAAFIQCAAGMGFALIVVPVCSLVEPALLPAVVLMLMVALSAYVAWRERSALDLSGVGWITAGRLPGTLVGLWILAVASGRPLELFIGASTIAAALLALATPKFTPGRATLVGVGVSPASPRRRPPSVDRRWRWPTSTHAARYCARRWRCAF